MAPPTKMTSAKSFSLSLASAIAWRKGYYRDTGEDAVVMLKNLKQKREVGLRHDLIPNVE